MSDTRQTPKDVYVEFDVKVAMRDGVELAADIYRPAVKGRCPVLLSRTPYGKDGPDIRRWLEPLRAVRHGFVVVVQDTRGRFASRGQWKPFMHEALDGVDTIAWARRLPYSNGKVGMYGDSYVGNTQWLAAIESPPGLAAIAPSMTWSDPLDGLFARDGVPEVGIAIPWDIATGLEDVAKLNMEGAPTVIQAEMIDAYDRLQDRGYDQIPARAPRGPEDLGTFSDQREAIVEKCRVAGRMNRVQAAVLNIGGWHDLFLQGTLDNYVAAAREGLETRLLVGPWTHLRTEDPIGELCYGLRSSRLGLPVHPEGDLADVQLCWFRRHLEGEDCSREEEQSHSPVRVFVMGANVWRDMEEWPPTAVRRHRWYFGRRGRLSLEADAGVSSTEFDYDPASPVPSIGGQTTLVPAMLAGPRDQRVIEERKDVLVFTSEPLPRDYEVTGRVRAVLHAQSSAPAADWIVRLCDVFPDGRSMNICDGIVRIEESADRLQEVEVDLWSTCNVFLAGHRLRVHVTSSSFPRWERNLNTGRQSESRFAIARQVLMHDALRASWIDLPIRDQ
jgi:putative CocE/NonD family hydrolase